MRAQGRAIVQVDAFTDRLFGGNPACVVPEADGLDAGTMQAIAREMRCSETAFVMRATRADCTERVRFFTPTEEVPMCGHATIAAYTVLATGAVPRMMECGAGALPIDVMRDGSVTWIAMTQNAPEIVEVRSREALAASVGLAREDARDDVPPQLVSTGERMAILPVRGRDVLRRCRPDPARIAALDGAPTGVYVVAFEETAQARFFGAAGTGIVEDPVTGAGAGAFAAWLDRHGRLQGEIAIAQGIEMGRAGVVRARMEAGRPVIVGRAVVVFASRINV
jgi:PhzF family phenazine biosynthesis protein